VFPGGTDNRIENGRTAKVGEITGKDIFADEYFVAGTGLFQGQFLGG